ncbi:MAG: FHA domain-containing protein [Nitriliruptorales bacterium]
MVDHAGPSLTVRTGDEAGCVLELDPSAGTVTLGRRQDNTFVFADPRVSRVHASLQCTSGEFILIDLGSSSGTTVNGVEVVGAMTLRHGDAISIGPVELEFAEGAGRVARDDDTIVLPVTTESSKGPQLSPRQQQVLERMARGMTNGEIAEELGVTERTVKAYAAEVYKKLAVHNRAGAVAEGLKQGILES